MSSTTAATGGASAAAAVVSSGATVGIVTPVGIIRVPVAVCIAVGVIRIAVGVRAGVAVVVRLVAAGCCATVYGHAVPLVGASCALERRAGAVGPVAVVDRLALVVQHRVSACGHYAGV